MPLRGLATGIFVAPERSRRGNPLSEAQRGADLADCLPSAAWDPPTTIVVWMEHQIKVLRFLFPMRPWLVLRSPIKELVALSHLQPTDDPHAALTPVLRRLCFHPDARRLLLAAHRTRITPPPSPSLLLCRTRDGLVRVCRPVDQVPCSLCLPWVLASPAPGGLKGAPVPVLPPFARSPESAFGSVARPSAQRHHASEPGVALESLGVRQLAISLVRQQAFALTHDPPSVFTFSLSRPSPESPLHRRDCPRAVHWESLAEHMPTCIAHPTLCKVAPASQIRALHSLREAHSTRWRQQERDHVLRIHAERAPECLAVGTPRGSVLLWDVATGRLFASWVAHPRAALVMMCHDPSTDVLLTAAKNGRVACWCTTTLVCCGRAAPGHSVRTSFPERRRSPECPGDGSSELPRALSQPSALGWLLGTVALGFSNGALAFAPLSLMGGEYEGVPHALWHSGPVCCIHGSSALGVFASSSNDGEVRVWTPQGNLLRSIGFGMMLSQRIGQGTCVGPRPPSPTLRGSPQTDGFVLDCPPVHSSRDVPCTAAPPSGAPCIPPRARRSPPPRASPSRMTPTPLRSGPLRPIGAGNSSPDPTQGFPKPQPSPARVDFGYRQPVAFCGPWGALAVHYAGGLYLIPPEAYLPASYFESTAFRQHVARVQEITCLRTPRDVPRAPDGDGAASQLSPFLATLVAHSCVWHTRPDATATTGRPLLFASRSAIPTHPTHRAYYALSLLFHDALSLPRALAALRTSRAPPDMAMYGDPATRPGSGSGALARWGVRSLEAPCSLAQHQGNCSPGMLSSGTLLRHLAKWRPGNLVRQAPKASKRNRSSVPSLPCVVMLGGICDDSSAPCPPCPSTQEEEQTECASRAEQEGNATSAGSDRCLSLSPDNMRVDIQAAPAPQRRESSLIDQFRLEDEAACSSKIDMPGSCAASTERSAPATHRNPHAKLHAKSHAKSQAKPQAAGPPARRDSFVASRVTRSPTPPPALPPDTSFFSFDPSLVRRPSGNWDARALIEEQMDRLRQEREERFPGHLCEKAQVLDGMEDFCSLLVEQMVAGAVRYVEGGAHEMEERLGAWAMASALVHNLILRVFRVARMGGRVESEERLEQRSTALALRLHVKSRACAQATDGFEPTRPLCLPAHIAVADKDQGESVCAETDVCAETSSQGSDGQLDSHHTEGPPQPPSDERSAHSSSSSEVPKRSQCGTHRGPTSRPDDESEEADVDTSPATECMSETPTIDALGFTKEPAFSDGMAQDSGSTGVGIVGRLCSGGGGGTRDSPEHSSDEEFVSLVLDGELEHTTQSDPCWGVQEWPRSAPPPPATSDKERNELISNKRELNSNKREPSQRKKPHLRIVAPKGSSFRTRVRSGPSPRRPAVLSPSGGDSLQEIGPFSARDHLLTPTSRRARQERRVPDSVASPSSTSTSTCLSPQPHVAQPKKPPATPRTLREKLRGLSCHSPPPPPVSHARRHRHPTCRVDHTDPPQSEFPRRLTSALFDNPRDCPELPWEECAHRARMRYLYRPARPRHERTPLGPSVCVIAQSEEPVLCRAPAPTQMGHATIPLPSRKEEPIIPTSRVPCPPRHPPHRGRAWHVSAGVPPMYIAPSRGGDAPPTANAPCPPVPALPPWLPRLRSPRSLPPASDAPARETPRGMLLNPEAAPAVPLRPPWRPTSPPLASPRSTSRASPPSHPPSLRITTSPLPVPSAPAPTPISTEGHEAFPRVLSPAHEPLDPERLPCSPPFRPGRTRHGGGGPITHTGPR